MLPLLAQESPSPLKEAIKFLETLRLPVTLTEAREFLVDLLAEHSLLRLYPHFFPREWAASTAPLSRRERGPGYSPREEEFLRLVDQELFPIHLEYLLEMAEEGERQNTIPIYYLGLEWWEVDPEEFRPAWQFLLALAGELQLPQPDFLDEETARLFEQAIEHSPDTARLTARAGEMGGELASLPLALAFLNHDTGNMLIDPSEEMPLEPLFWEEEDLQWAKEEYQKAQEILDKVYRFCDWLEEDPGNYRKVIGLWLLDRD